MHTFTVHCPHCGSDQLTYAERYIVRRPVTNWRRNGFTGEIEPDKLGPDELLFDTGDLVDYPYDCKSCGKVEMTSDDLIVKGA